MRISDWSSDVCSSDLDRLRGYYKKATNFLYYSREGDQPLDIYGFPGETGFVEQQRNAGDGTFAGVEGSVQSFLDFLPGVWKNFGVSLNASHILKRSEEHKSELQSLMRISYAVFCLKKKKNDTKR